MHSKHNATIDASFINRDFAYTPWERQNMDLLNAGATTSEVIMPALKPGSFGAFDFGEEQSVTTIKTHATAGEKTNATYEFQRGSVYSIGTDADLSLGLNDGDEMDEDGNEGRQVEVVMPKGGLSGKSTEGDGENEGSYVSAQEPTNLFGRDGNPAAASEDMDTNMEEESPAASETKEEENEDENVSTTPATTAGQAMLSQMEQMQLLLHRMDEMKAEMDVLRIENSHLSVLANSLPPTQIPLPSDDNSLIQYAEEATASQTDASVSNSQGAAIQKPTPNNAAPGTDMAAETDKKDVVPSHPE